MKIIGCIYAKNRSLFVSLCEIVELISKTASKKQILKIHEFSFLTIVCKCLLALDSVKNYFNEWNEVSRGIA